MGRRKKDGKFVNCYISSNIVETLETVSEDTGKSKTRIIEDALTEHFENHGYWTRKAEVSKQGELEQPLFDKTANAFLITENGDTPCRILKEMTVYGEPYCQIECSGGEIRKVHRSMVELRSL